MKWAHLLIALVGGLMMTACAPVAAPGPGASGPVTITLTRGVCFGFCPDYTVRIDQDGAVSYEGRRFVNVIGAQRAQIPVTDVARLIARFDAVNFTSLRDEYRAQVTDLPTYTLTLERGGVRKRVLDYGGLSAGLPEAVRALENEVDRVAGTARWVLRDGEPVRTPNNQR